MPRKKSLQNSKSADSCSCGCCRWHSSRTLRLVLAAMFVLIVIALAASIVFRYNPYFNYSILSFIGVIFLVVFIGWGFGFFCSCRGTHWSRHGVEVFDESRSIARKRYAEGKISKKEYDKIVKDLN